MAEPTEHSTGTHQLPRFYSLGPTLIQFIAVPLGTFVFIIFTRLQLKGLENLKRAARHKRKTGKGVILAGNHVSELDGVLITSGVRPLSSLSPLFYISAEQKHFLTSEKFGWRSRIYGSLFLRLCGAYPISKGQKNYEKALKYHLMLLERGRTICIFPEGTMVKDKEKESQAHGGVTYLAHETGALIVPVYISGTRDLTFRKFITFRARVKVTYGKPIPAEELFEDKEPIVENGVNDFRDAAQEIINTIEGLPRN